MWFIDILKSIWIEISGWFSFLSHLIANNWLFLVIFSGASLVLSIVGCAALITYLPPNYFNFNETHPARPIINPILRHFVFVLKNVVGFLLIVAGVLLSVPGVPGQGLLTILSGLIISDFPGKKRLARRIIRIRAVYVAANKIRAKFNRPPLILDEN